jgi:hypothetical protein
MKQLKPRTIMLIGIPAFSLAFAAPFVFWADSMGDLYAAAMGGVLFTTLVGLPIFGTMALAARWSYTEPDDDPVTLDRRYRHIERYFACAGMLSLGYMVGWFVNCPLVLHLDESASTIQSIVSLILLLVSMLVMMVVAIAKIGLVKRLEILKDRIEAAKKGKSNGVSAA